MIVVLRILTLIFVVLAMVPAVAHALELPGKLRLTKDAYVAVQPIYYPGFTIVGIAEPVGGLDRPARPLGVFARRTSGTCGRELPRPSHRHQLVAHRENGEG
jgi:hypothetical protein